MRADKISKPVRNLPGLLSLVAVSLAGWLFASSGVAAQPSRDCVEYLLAQRDKLGKAGALPRMEQSVWYTSGPLRASAFSESLFPEKSVNLEETRGGRKAWKAQEMADGVVHPLKAGDGTSTYFYRTITAGSAGPISLSFGSDDGIEFWFNGEKLLSRDVPRGAGPDQDVLRVNLREGTNQALVKIYNRTGDSGMYYNLVGAASGLVAAASREYPAEAALLSAHISLDSWFRQAQGTELEQKALRSLLGRLKGADQELKQFEELVRAKSPATDPGWLRLTLALAGMTQRIQQAQESVAKLDLVPLRLAIQDLCDTHGDRYPKGAAYLRDLDAFERALPALKTALAAGDIQAPEALARYEALRHNALLANPALDFEKILLVRRSTQNLCLPQNWQGNSSLNVNTENEIVSLAYKDSSAKPVTVYRPESKVFVGDVDLHFGGDRMLFSSIGTHHRWQVFEVKRDGTGLRQVSSPEEVDIDSYDPMYLPDGRIIFDSTSTFQGVPCVGGGDYVANLHIMNPDGTGVRRLCFDQDNDWCPTMLPNGRVLYLRWEYTDSAHYFSRVLMSMNPDGTGQMEFYGSNSYWPNSLFYARPLPGSATKFVGIVTGHHGVPRMGEMVVFDSSKGRQEDSGALYRIPGYGKPVKGIIKDALVDESWPKFLHPYPLSDKHYLVSCKPTPDANWGVYLVDMFDNILLLKEEPGYALLEPLPLRKTVAPPALQDRVNLADKTSTVFLQDVHAGAGLAGVPRGTVKNLRVFQYEFSYRNQGGHYFVGMEGGWDIRRLIGTVPVMNDGSAMFRIPANTPVAIQPLDAEGKALQQMRSWFVGMPGEYVSCVGCHERQNASASLAMAEAARLKPSEPKPWYGPKRGFSFVREVQPVLDRHCSGCHNGQEGRPNLADTTVIPTSGGISDLPRSYVELHPYVRRNGPEGDYHTLTPLEFHVDTSRLVQMLRKGHHNVKLEPEAWDRLVTWIDINVPAYGTFHEISRIPKDFEKRRYETKKKYAGVDEDIEAIPVTSTVRPEFQKPAPEAARPARLQVEGWPVETAEARNRQQSAGDTALRLDMGNGMQMAFRKIPAGQFAMGDVEGEVDEFPMSVVKVDQPFWMAETEVSLEQYQQFDANHRNGYYDMHYKDQVRPGYLMDSPKKPVIRVSWHQAMAFCEWLSARTGRQVLLPTEAQWEWACRAGTSTPMFYGDLNTDFSRFANLADASIAQLAVSGVDPQPISKPDKFWDFVPKEGRFNDGVLHLSDCGKYEPNAWGLRDMIGNVAEWVLDDYALYPYRKASDSAAGRKVARGGSWAERPKESRASSRVDYPAWQRVYNVGFRVVISGADVSPKVAAVP
jgi:formylglycine-generating enzyme required for sulfatase activity